jgi:hypothetical protein
VQPVTQDTIKKIRTRQHKKVEVEGDGDRKTGRGRELDRVREVEVEGERERDRQGISFFLMRLCTQYAAVRLPKQDQTASFVFPSTSNAILDIIPLS